MSNSNLEILAYEASPLGLLCLRRRELLSQPGTIVTEVTLNHEFLMSSLYTDSERALARTALEMQSGDDLRVSGRRTGAGLYGPRSAPCRPRRAGRSGGVAAASDRLACAWIGTAFVRARNEWATAALGRHSRRRLPAARRPPDDLFDVILIDVDHSPDERLDEGERLVLYHARSAAARRHLAPTASWRCGPTPRVHRLQTPSREVFEQVRVEPVTYRQPA